MNGINIKFYQNTNKIHLIHVAFLVFVFFHCFGFLQVRGMRFPGLSMGHIYLSHSHPLAIYACPISSHPTRRFPWDSHRNDIPMDKPGDFTVQMLYWYCAVAHFKGSIGCKNVLCWQQCFFSTHVSLHIV